MITQGFLANIFFTTGTVVFLVLLCYLLWSIFVQAKKFAELEEKSRSAESEADRLKKDLKVKSDQMDTLKQSLDAARQKIPEQCLVDQAKVEEFTESIKACNLRYEALFKAYSALATWINESVAPTLAKCAGGLEQAYAKNIEEACQKKDAEWVSKVATERQEMTRLQAALTKVGQEYGVAQATVNRLEEEKRNLEIRLGKTPELEAEVGRLNAALQMKEREISSFDWIVPAQNAWAGTVNNLSRLFMDGQFNWYTPSFRNALLQALTSTLFPLSEGEKDATVNGTPDEIMMRVDEVFYERLHGDDGQLDVLEKARMLYFECFNKLFFGKYAIRWPRKGESFDESYCRLDRDNGFTEVRVAITCAIFVANGDLKRRARVETVPRT